MELPKTPIADLHCDLLCYLEKSSSRQANDREVRCSLPQLLKGNVKWQICAIFTETGPHSVRKGAAQAGILLQLPKQETLSFLPAFENASGFCNEIEPFAEAISRLESFIKNAGQLSYISLTWNTENRFGGGAHTKTGLKEDGKRLLEWMHGKKIALDLSHASDYLAFASIHYIDQNELDIPMLASHSNARAVKDVPRNLPTDIAKEIFRRKGLVGLNLYAPFLGGDPESILRHLEFWLKLGGEKGICLGSDFFYEADFSTIKNETPYFSEFENASRYPDLLVFIARELRLDTAMIEHFAYRNFLNFNQASLSNRIDGPSP